MVVEGRSVAWSKLVRERGLFWRAYGWPFVPLYAWWAYEAFLSNNRPHQPDQLDQPDQSNGNEWVRLWLLGVVGLHALSVLVCQWSMRIRIVASCALLKNPREENAQVCVVPPPNKGRPELCPVRILNSNTPAISFQQKTYVYDEEKKRFRSIDYPVHHDIQWYRSQLGHTTDSISLVSAQYGANKFIIPMPTFAELFRDHAVAPFFVFQVFCVGLWFMDEYWYYSLFTLFMLFVFESTVVHQRLRSLTELRSMTQQPYSMFVYRNKKWISVQSEALLPGDIVSIVRAPSEEITVPCDVLLLQGSCIVNEAMLSGESTPLVKESIETFDQSSAQLDMQSNQFRPYILFGGTKILQHTSPSTHSPSHTNNNKNNNINASMPPPPDHGCVGFVLRTGFGTTQGKLVRTMIFGTDRVSANNKESFLFILFLLIFAISAAYHVWHEGHRIGRKPSKLILDCIMIITSVVPPELPMELSMAVNQSLMALAKVAIFCTEPFRIPVAGKVDVCCFDKTGTLTGEDLVVEGVAGLKGAIKLMKTSDMPPMTVATVATCHALVMLDGKLVGDPMEKAIMDKIEWTLTPAGAVQPKHTPTGKSTPHFTILKRFPFSSSLKRMAVIAAVQNANDFIPAVSNFIVTVKGAPEVLRGMFAELPDHYDETYKYFSMKGSRVLALGWKWYRPKVTGGSSSTATGSISSHELKDLERDHVECGLQFAGFLVFHCPLKPDTKNAISELHASMHRIVMITGDNPLTACHIARELKIVRRPTMVLDTRDEEGRLSWRSVDESIDVPLPETDLSMTHATDAMRLFLKTFDLCVTGHALERISGTYLFESILLPRVWVYARTSPSQKEYILTALKNTGYTTLMCGDGTNDVGALKQAHIGVALLNGTVDDLNKIAEGLRKRRMIEMRKKQEELAKAWGLPTPQEYDRREFKELSREEVAKLTPVERKRYEAEKMQKKVMGKMMDTMEDVDEPPVLKFGDASVAAPFTSKLGSINSICNIIRQGRCTLVTTIQMYKILALNCLISAFTLSALYLDGIKYGDTQMTVQGFLIAGCFLFLSWGKPIQRLSRERPQPNIFNWYILLSVLGQFAVHAYCLWNVVVEAKSLLPADWEVDLDSTKFDRNILNTGVYLISLAMQVSTFLINYQGRPFRESLRENRPLFVSLSSIYAAAVFGAGQVFPALNEYLELVPMTDHFSDLLVRYILSDLAACFAIESVSSFLFSNNKPSSKLGLDDKEWEEMGDVDEKHILPTRRYSLD